MELQFSEINDVRLIKLIGRLDAAGFNDIDLKFTAHCSGDNARVLVDLSEVSFLASIGIRLLTMNARSLSTRSGKMVLFGPIPEVKSVLDMTGISAIIPMYEKRESAEAVLMAQ
jgi:anti-anti-sigma factor